MVKIVLEGENKKNYILKLALSGEFIGLSALFHDETSPFSAICLDDCEVILIKLDPFKSLFKNNPELNDCIIKLRSSYFRLVYDRLTIQATRNIHGKLAHTLLYVEQQRAQDPNLYPNTDWYGLIMKDRAPRQSHVLSLSGGTDVIATKASLVYDKTEGLYDFSESFNGQTNYNIASGLSLDDFENLVVDNLDQ